MGIEAMLLASAIGAQAAGMVNSNVQSKRAAGAADRNARDQAAAADRASNAANQKQPDISALMSRVAAGAQGGPGSTMLTGPQGVSQDALKLARTTLLGQ